MTAILKPGGAAAERAAWIFYTIAALGSSIGQIWGGVTTPPWPDVVPWWARAILVLPFAVVLDLGGVVCSAFADWRQRLGEAAYGWRALSLASVIVGVGVNVVTHADVLYLAVVFGSLGSFAYAVWIGHAGARRRDALRAQGLLGNPPPVFGWRQWKREPEVTLHAKNLALVHGFNLHEALAAARQQVTDEKNRKALAAHLTTLLAARHQDANLANILVAAVPGDELAAEVAKLIDIGGWARMIAADLQPPAAPDAEPTDGNGDGEAPGPPAALLKEVPGRPEEYARWHEIWLAVRSEQTSNKVLADKYNVSQRTMQRLRSAGALGLLDSPIPLIERVLGEVRKVTRVNGHGPTPPATPQIEP